MISDFFYQVSTVAVHIIKIQKMLSIRDGLSWGVVLVGPRMCGVNHFLVRRSKNHLLLCLCQTLKSTPPFLSTTTVLSYFWCPGRMPAINEGLLSLCQVSVNAMTSNWYSRSLRSISSYSELPCSEQMFVCKSENLSFLPELMFLFSLWNSWFK